MSKYRGWTKDANLINHLAGLRKALLEYNMSISGMSPDYSEFRFTERDIAAILGAESLAYYLSVNSIRVDR